MRLNRDRFLGISRLVNEDRYDAIRALKGRVVPSAVMNIGSPLRKGTQSLFLQLRMDEGRCSAVMLPRQIHAAEMTMNDELIGITG